METAVKVQSMASVKTPMAGRSVSLEASVRNGDFTKMLQEKKDLADVAEQIGQKQTSKKDEEPVKKTSGKKEEDPKAPEKEDQDVGQKEALQQATLQQAAAQAAGILTEEPQTAETEPVVLTEAVNVQEIHEDVPMVQTEPKEAEPIRQEAAPVIDKVPEENSKSEVVTPQAQEAVGPERKIETRSDAQGQEKEKDLTGSNERKTQEGPVTDNHSATYSGASFRVSGQTEQHVFHDSGRVTDIPLKTTPQTLPEDLGKTLAARLPDTGRTLTVELEPASLGKLTIRMTYEAGRAAVSIMATNPRTLELLNEKASEIAAILEEKTGQNTVILTQQPHEQEQYQENKDGAAGQGDGREQNRQEKEEKGQHSDSFAQQLRLGLV